MAKFVNWNNFIIYYFDRIFLATQSAPPNQAGWNSWAQIINIKMVTNEKQSNN